MTDHYLKGHDVAVVLAGLAEVERRIDALPAGSRASRFQRVGPWLVERGFLISLLARGARAVPAVPGLSRLGVFPLAKALLSPAYVQSTSRAQAVHFKSSARAFYLLPQPITIKLSGSQTPHWGLANEVEAHRLAPGKLRCSRLIQYELESTAPFVCEEMIDGRRPDRSRDRELVIDFILNPLWSYYASLGFELVRCSDLYDVGALLRGVRAAAAEQDWDSTWLERGRFLDEILELSEERDKYVPCCAGHGDLSDGNMVVGNDDRAIYLVDWERARKLSVVCELRKIFLQYAGTWDLIAPRLRSLTGGRPDSQVVPLARQALLDVLAWIVEFQRWSPASEKVDARRREVLERKRSRLLRREFASASRLLSDGAY